MPSTGRGGPKGVGRLPCGGPGSAAAPPAVLARRPHPPPRWHAPLQLYQIALSGLKAAVAGLPVAADVVQVCEVVGGGLRSAAA